MPIYVLFMWLICELMHAPECEDRESYTDHLAQHHNAQTTAASSCFIYFFEYVFHSFHILHIFPVLAKAKVCATTSGIKRDFRRQVGPARIFGISCKCVVHTLPSVGRRATKQYLRFFSSCYNSHLKHSV